MAHIGVDLIEIKRVEAAVACWGQRFLRRIFTPAELRVCKGRVESLAARFAAKEAVMKALGTGFDGAGWLEVVVLADESGRPLLRLRGRARKKANELGIREFAVSLSHSTDHAIAYVHGS